MIAVEAATAVSRKVLRPDLYGESAVRTDHDPSMLRAPRNTRCLPPCCHQRRRPRCSSRSRNCATMRRRLGVPTRTLAEAASQAVAADVEREYFDLFVGLGRGELLPYASYYLTGFLNERPLSRLRDDLAALGIERVENNFEPEDHAATLCEIMAGLASGRFPASPEVQRAFFEKHVSRWMGRLFADMENA